MKVRGWRARLVNFKAVLAKRKKKKERKTEKRRLGQRRMPLLFL